MDLLDLVKKLVSFNTVNPPGDQTECAGFIRDYLEEFACVNVLVKDGVENIVAEVIFSKSGKNLVFNGHWDTVPAIADEWEADPFTPFVKNGWIYGRGSGDMKGGLAAMMHAFKRISMEEGFEGKITLMAVGDEETGGRRGTRFVLERYNDRIDHVIIGEPTGLKLKVGRRGVIRIRVEVIGEEKHSAYVYSGCLNPIEVASELVSFFARLDLKDGTEIMPRTTFAATMIQGGIKENMVPQKCSFVVDVRNTPFVDVNRVEELIRKKVYELQEKYKGLEVNVSLVEGGKPYLLKNSPIVSLSAIVLNEMNIPVVYDAGGGASDGRFFVEKGVRNVVEFGPIAKNIHGVNEAVQIESILKSKRFYEEIARRVLSL